MSVTATNALYNGGFQSAGDVTWNHQAGGLVQAGLTVANPLYLGPILTPSVPPTVQVVDVQLAATTQTIGNSLRFGRVLETNLLAGSALLDLLAPNALNDLTNSVVGASVANQWASSATLSNLTLDQGVLYSASFTVNTSGLNLSALSSANFSLTSGGTVIDSVNSDSLLNLLDVLQIGGGLATIDYQFYAPASTDELTFNFSAQAVADVGLLGGITDNQTVMEFTGFSLAPVPEPGSLALASIGFMVLLRRRRLWQS